MNFELYARKLKRVVEAAEIRGVKSDANLPRVGLCEFKINPPLDASLTKKIVESIPDTIPSQLLNFFTQQCSELYLNWNLKDGVQPPFRQVFAGLLDLNFALLPRIYATYRGWVEGVFPDPRNSYDVIWHKKFPFMDVPNGDMLAIDPTTQAVIYLSHEDGSGHGCRLAASIAEFLESYIALACVGPEDWQWLPFFEDGLGLNPHGINGTRWREWFGLPGADTGA
jgi:hypothetical protein